mgnify:CR=1 FL=1
MRGRRRDRQPGHRLENTIIVLRGYPLHRRCGGAFSGTRSRTARAYVQRLEQLSGVPVSMVSVGPDRNQTIFR